MKLFHSAASPFVRKVMVVLHETDQLDAVEILPAQVSPTLTGDPALQHNPLGKIPALVRPDGPALYDSRVICRYLDSLAGGQLYPEGQIWDLLTLEATADGILDAAVLMVYEFRCREEGEHSEAWLAGQWGKVERALDAVSERWMSTLAGPLNIGHIGMGCALSYLDFRHSARDWRSGRPALADWHRDFAARPSMQATVPA